MALLRMEGFDNDRLSSDITYDPGTYGRVGYVAGRVVGRAISIYSAAATAAIDMHFPVPASTSSSAGVAIRWNNSDPRGSNYTYLSLEEAGAARHFGMRIDTNGYPTIVDGPGNVLATSNTSVNPFVWNHYELTGVVDSVAGNATLRINGVVVAQVTGANTRNGGAGVVDKVILKSGTVTTSSNCYWDDFYITNGNSLGDCRVDTLRPNATGASSAWLGSDGNSVDNWAMVDDMSTTTDYVGSSTVGAKDLYEMSNVTVTTGTVYGIQTEFFAAKSDAGTAPGPIDIVERKSDGTERVQAAVAPAATLSTDYQWARGAIRETDPSGAAWTIASVNSLQVGVQVGTP